MEGRGVWARHSHHDPLRPVRSTSRMIRECVTGRDHTVSGEVQSWSKRIKVEPIVHSAAKRVENDYTESRAIPPGSTRLREGGIKRFGFRKLKAYRNGARGAGPGGIEPGDPRPATIDQRGHKSPLALDSDRRPDRHGISRLRPSATVQAHIPDHQMGALAAGRLNFQPSSIGAHGPRSRRSENMQHLTSALIRQQPVERGWRLLQG